MKALLSGIVLSACLMGATPAGATVLDYTINNGTFSDGTTFSGTFDYDADANSVSAFDISTSTGTLPAFEYDASDSTAYMFGYGPNAISFIASGGERYLTFAFASPLSSGTSQSIDTSSSWDCDNCGTWREVTGGSISIAPSVSAAVPEPATWAMMLFGFGGIGFAMRRKRTPVFASA